MNLARHEVERFYNIWFPLLHYVNQRLRLSPSFPDQWGPASVWPEATVPLRDALWADDRLREAFIADNPTGLSADDLALVASWQHRVAGEFFVFRYLKAHTVFLSGDSPMRGYGVLGLTSPIADILGSYLPRYVSAVLLPFEGRIIYDSLLLPYAISFGGGIRYSLKENYRRVQERQGLITKLVPSAEDEHPEYLKRGIRSRNQKILKAFQQALGRSGLSPKMMTEHSENIERFADGVLLGQSPPRGLLEVTIFDVRTYLQVGKPNPVSLKRFVQFLRDTGRLDYDQAEGILDVIKHERQRLSGT
jgi:hypothetical protein